MQVKYYGQYVTTRSTGKSHRNGYGVSQTKYESKGFTKYKKEQGYFNSSGHLIAGQYYSGISSKKRTLSQNGYELTEENTTRSFSNKHGCINFMARWVPIMDEKDKEKVYTVYESDRSGHSVGKKIVAIYDDKKLTVVIEPMNDDTVFQRVSFK